MNKRRKILMVLEDEVALMDIIKSRLESEDYNVIAARDAGKALSLLNEIDHLDAIWLDHYLYGKLDGLDFVKALRLISKWKNLPVFVVSNTVSPEKIKKYRELNIQDYYAKVDFPLDDIIGGINKVLKNKL